MNLRRAISQCMDYSFPKSRRLTRTAQFDAVFRERRSAADQVLVVYGIANDLGHPRLGMVVSRKVSTRAVVRNRWKRILREAFRLSQHELPALDLVCLPRAGTEPNLEEVMRSLKRQARRIASRLPAADPAPSDSAGPQHAKEPPS